MVGLVVVSHSHALAEAAVALAAEMLHGQDVPLEIAAGLDETTFGTDAMAITEAIVAADRGDGVVVLMDLGSAVLSAELALDLLDDDALRDRVTLCPAPLVEGLVSAAVSAASGATRDEVASEAAAGLAGKQSQLGTPTRAEQPQDAGTGEGVPFTVTNPHGLHARPAARLVAEARRFDAKVELRNRTTSSSWVPAASLSRVATLAALKDHELEVRASGPDAAAAVEAVVALAARAFDESPDTVNSAPYLTVAPPLTSTAPGPSASGPSASGTAAPRAAEPEESLTPSDDISVKSDSSFAYGLASDPPASDSRASDPAPPPSHEISDKSDLVGEARGADAMRRPDVGGWAEAVGRTDGIRRGGDFPRRGVGASRGVGALRGVGASPGVAVGGVWQAHAVAVEMPETPSEGAVREWARVEAAVEGVREELRGIDDQSGIFEAHLMMLEDDDLLDDVRARVEAGEAAPQAWAAGANRVAGEFDALADPYLQARAADVRAVGDQVLRAILGVPAATLDGSGVLIAEDLTPAETAGLDPADVTGLLLADGSPTSHAAIIARTRGIPAIVGLGPEILDLADGTLVAFDGGSGEIAVAPGDDVLASFRERAREQQRRHAESISRANDPAITKDGTSILVGANIGSVEDARAATGADLAGLVRTEFLFLDRDAAPSVDEQVATYRGIAEALGGKRITLRTLDVGGDKPLRYLPGPAEQNPFLGVRGLRHSLDHPQLFADQLLAIATVARDVPVSVMFPMVSTVDEVVRARELLDDAVAKAGPAQDLQVGIMMEVPAAALKAAALAPYVDFFSIGTNDLTQYTLAAERGNPALAQLADGLDPGVLRLIDAICRAAGERVLVAVCGELAADETAIPLLIDLGVCELSVAPPLVPATKEAVRATTVDATRAARALDLPSAADVRKI
jgi:phosphoenolpyruvate-protein phosphotransferase/dihydroxyacetone kinase phosphotransfer subunit